MKVQEWLSRGVTTAIAVVGYGKLLFMVRDQIFDLMRGREVLVVAAVIGVLAIAGLLMAFLRWLWRI